MLDGILGVGVVLLAVASIGLLATVPVGMSALIRGNTRRLLHTAAAGAVLFAVAFIAALALGAQPLGAGILS